MYVFWWCVESGLGVPDGRQMLLDCRSKDWVPDNIERDGYRCEWHLADASDISLDDLKRLLFYEIRDAAPFSPRQATVAINGLFALIESVADRVDESTALYVLMDLMCERGPHIFNHDIS